MSSPVAVLEQNPRVDLQQERSFLDSSLPRTMALAGKHNRTLVERLKAIDATWPFEDRVLVWLAGHWGDDITRYHSGESPGMSERFMSHQLEHLDGHYLRKLQEALRPLGDE